MPPVITVMFAAVEVQAMTGTASPSWKPRAEARKASTEARTATGSHGELSRPSGPPTVVRAFSATSPTPNRVPAAAPRIAPWWWAGVPSFGAAISRMPSASIPAWKAIRAGTAKAEWSPRCAGG